MSVPAIALYASSPSSICSPAYHSCQIGSHGSSDYDLNPRPSSSSASPSNIAHKPIVGGLSCLFSSPSVLHASSSSSLSFPGGDDLGQVRHDRLEEIGCSYSYSSSLKSKEHSPLSVLHGPVSWNGSGTIAVGSSSRSPQLNKSLRDLGDFRVGRDRLFSGFVRNALGSCIDYDTPILPATSGSRLGSEELEFDIEDGFTEEDSCEPYAKEMLRDAQSRHEIFREAFVIKAFYEAEKAHRGQMRATGHPYLQHCMETAVLLANIGANATVVAAGLLHDTTDDSFVDYDDILLSFGAGVADLVRGVSKISQLSKLARDNDTANKASEADKMHTMFLAMADARAVLIKLADRLHNMMTLDALPMVKQQRFAKETLEIFAPLANRLGIFTWKEQLENLCFKHLYPEKHRELSSELLKTFDEGMVVSSKEKLEHALNVGGVSYHVLHGRHKSLYSIYSKMLKKKLNMKDIHDIHGLRLIVENEADCYRALSIVHGLWPQVEGRFKDYMIRPKYNGYQSLHTVVMSEDMVPMEVQIRTKEMHLQAEFGFAAHWRYKESDCKHPSFVLQMVEWARWVMTWHIETMNKTGQTNSIKPPCSFPSHSKDCPFSYKPQGDHDEPVFIVLLENEKLFLRLLMPHMSVEELPADSTLKDLLERVGHVRTRSTACRLPVEEELRAKLNHEPMTDCNIKLMMGDVVELTPSIPDKSLTEYREEIQRMYNQGLAVSGKTNVRNATSPHVHIVT